jgi:hypothetical protein
MRSVSRWPVLSNKRTRVLSWFRLWAVRPTCLRSWHYIARHRGARRGGLQARRERRRCPQVPAKWLRQVPISGEWVSANGRVVDRSGPGWAATSSFYRPRGGGLQLCRMALGIVTRYCYAILVIWRLSWRIQVPPRVVVAPVLIRRRLRGWPCRCPRLVAVRTPIRGSVWRGSPCWTGSSVGVSHQDKAP